MSPLLVLASAWAQDYRFPTSEADYGEFYVTAYLDHDGVDWACGAITYDGHQGSDFGVGSWAGMEEGRDLVAAADGVVVATNDGEYDECSSGACEGGGGYGNYVWIQHPDGKMSLYAHMAQWSVAVAVGQEVSCGDTLGLVGSSGYSTGPHLHFGVWATSASYHDPFYGDCASPPSYWVDQGAYDGLPSLDCDTPPPCTPAGALACGDTLSSSNEAEGSTAEHAYYGCGEWVYTGREIAWSFATDRDEPVVVSATGLSADLDLHVTEGEACDAHGCVGASDGSKTSDERVEFNAAAGTGYLIVLDGYDGAVSSFSLSVACEGSPPGEAAEETGEGPGAPDSGPPGDSPEDKVESNEPRGKRESAMPGPCGCGGGLAGSGAALAALLVALRRRAARR